MNRIDWLMAISLGILLYAPVQARAECYMDTPSGYGSIGGSSHIGPYPDRSSCEAVNSQYFNGGGSCSCTSSGDAQGSGSAGSGFNPNMSPDQMMLNTMQGLMGNFISGFQKGMEQNRQRAIQQQRENEQHQRAMQAQAQERERLFKEEEKRHRLEFERAKERVLGQMRGIQSPSLQSRKLEPLAVQETSDTFGVKTLKPRDLSRSTQLAAAVPDSNGWKKRANCSAYLLNKALGNWNQQHFEEAAYLSQEAAASASGKKSAPSVVCPPLPDVADIGGEQVPEDRAKAEKFMRQTLLISKIFTEAASQMRDYKAIRQARRQARQKVDEARDRLQAARARKATIEREQQQETDAKKTRMMAEALAALKKAKEALALSEKRLADAGKKKAEIEEKMQNTRVLITTAQEDPSSTDRLLSQLSGHADTRR